MRRLLMTAMAATAIMSAAPAFAQATLADQNGPDLAVRIHASQDPTNVAPNVGPVVYGNAGPANTAGHNTSFSGYTSFNTTTNTGVATDININEGGGFAQIHDNDFNSQIASTQNLYDIVMDPSFAFTQYEFSIQLASDGLLTVWVDLTGGGTNWVQAVSNPIALPTGGANNQFILTAAAGTSIDKVLISTTAPIFELKQNSITPLAGALPEPATWAMMLLGFGGIGMTMRRSRKRTGQLLQIA